jgi:lipoate-protein ligase A
MAVDEAIARGVAQHLAPPTLRFYAWAPPSVSLGRNQPAGAVDAARCAERGYDIVRRPTGGRAILHTDELTYSVAAAANHSLVSGMVLDAYLRISNGLVEGLHRLGIPAEEAPGTTRTAADVSAACFEVPSAYEILAHGRKLLGSAQSRRSDVVLQHGSLPLTGDLTRLVDCLVMPSEEEREALRRSLADHAATLEQVTGRPVSFEDARSALIAGFASALDLELVAGDMLPEEHAWAGELVRERYAAPDWTARR